ncbi:MAG: hypothetical protein J3K34DRAFT_407459 [Monoraphidium minutum]|nr:MAG: hypothetical protein J3K34DRAFT_407459 [Monoraphidium minutum]
MERASGGCFPPALACRPPTRAIWSRCYPTPYPWPASGGRPPRCALHRTATPPAAPCTHPPFHAPHTGVCARRCESSRAREHNHIQARPRHPHGPLFKGRPTTRTAHTGRRQHRSRSTCLCPPAMPRRRDRFASPGRCAAPELEQTPPERCSALTVDCTDLLSAHIVLRNPSSQIDQTACAGPRQAGGTPPLPLCEHAPRHNYNRHTRPVCRLLRPRPRRGGSGAAPRAANGTPGALSFLGAPRGAAAAHPRRAAPRRRRRAARVARRAQRHPRLQSMAAPRVLARHKPAAPGQVRPRRRPALQMPRLRAPRTGSPWARESPACMHPLCSIQHCICVALGYSL